jgi:hypothetical protein
MLIVATIFASLDDQLVALGSFPELLGVMIG